MPILRDQVFDLETYSECDLRKANAPVYGKHPTTEMLCFAYLGPTHSLENDDICIWRPGDPEPTYFLDCIRAGKLMWAHNVAFERSLWNFCIAPKMGWPEIQPDQWRDTLAECSRCCLPRGLADAAKELGLNAQKDTAGNRVMLQLCKPKKGTKSKGYTDTRYTRESHPDKFRTLDLYCAQDVRTQFELMTCLIRLSDAELRVWQLDQKINFRGLPIDLESVDHAIRICEQVDKQLATEISTLTNGEVDAPSKVTAIRAHLKEEYGLDAPDLAKATVVALLEGDLDPIARRILEIRKAGSLASVKKLVAMVKKACPDDGRVRCGLAYHGAGTGRWAGRGVQMHNFTKGKLDEENTEIAFRMLALEDPDLLAASYGDPATIVSGCLRGMIMAPPGRELHVCDFSGIEARVNAWVCGQDDMIEVFLRGDDIYKHMASKIYGKPISEITKSERQVGKAAILGLGYGMGKDKFLGELHKIDESYTLAFATQIVNAYREANDRIKSGWYALNTAAVKAVETGKPQKARGLVFRANKDWMTIELYNGRRLFYRRPEIEEKPAPWNKKQILRNVTYMSINSVTRKWERTRTYGGKLIENVVQAIARDLLVDAMFRVEDSEMPFEIIGTVHDEVIAEAPDGTGTRAWCEDEENWYCPEFDALMVEVPKWAKGCPIGVAGFVARRYRK